MGYFGIFLDNDITYLLSEIGQNIKVNNIDSKAIINNVDNEFDDKKIITKSELKRGDYIEYNNLYFLIMDEINDKRYNNYYKGIIRKCNFNIKFIVGDRLFLYYAIIEGDKFYIQNDSIISMSADTITVTLPKTDVTKQLKEQDCFIKWGKKWEIQGINYTKSGLIILNCKATTINTNTDDIVNEIANRYKDGKDVLGGNITPILPFTIVEPEPTELNIIDISTLDDITVENGTTVDTITLPQTITVTLEDSTNTTLSIVWDTSIYNSDVAGTYNIVGAITLVEGITNTNNITANINIVVKEATLSGYTYTITAKTVYPSDPDDEIYWNDTVVYTVHKFDNDVEVDGNFTFEVYQQHAKTKEWIQPSSISEVTNTTNNTINIKATEGKQGYIKFIATDTETNQIAIEKQIKIRGVM